MNDMIFIDVIAEDGTTTSYTVKAVDCITQCMAASALGVELRDELACRVDEKRSVAAKFAGMPEIEDLEHLLWATALYLEQSAAVVVDFAADDEAVDGRQIEVDGIVWELLHLSTGDGQ